MNEAWEEDPPADWFAAAEAVGKGVWKRPVKRSQAGMATSKGPVPSYQDILAEFERRTAAQPKSPPPSNTPSFEDLNAEFEKRTHAR